MMVLRVALFTFLAAATAGASQPGVCEPPGEIRAELDKAAALPIADPTAFEQNVAAFRALRDRYPDDLFVHERYQDAVRQNGIEGHLRQLTEEYQTLALQHPGDLMYRYLFARSMMGRGTLSAIRQMNDILAEHPESAPAHRALAEIYGAETFRDPGKQQTERDRFLALCPGSVVPRRPAPPPDRSPLIRRAEQMLAQNGDPDAVAAMALAGLRADEWRLQRIRPFDWYSADYKRQNQRELQTEYWRVWSLQVRCYRKAHQPERAAEVLRVMEQRATRLRSRSDPNYWDALAALARLYVEEGQKAQAEQSLNDLQQLLAQRPDTGHAAELEDLRRLLAGSGRAGHPH
jgi:hypothetical protein